MLCHIFGCSAKSKVTIKCDPNLHSIMKHDSYYPFEWLVSHECIQHNGVMKLCTFHDKARKNGVL